MIGESAPCCSSRRNHYLETSRWRLQCLVASAAFLLGHDAVVALTISTAGSICHVHREGVTSLHRFSPKGRHLHFFYVGTKRGSVQEYVKSDNNEESFELVRELRDPSATSLPVYSMTTFQSDDRFDTAQLMCGGGNRFVSVWDLSDEGTQFSQNLGPHTGWVKDVTYDRTRNLVHSIGCNCVETWERFHDDDKIPKWRHATKRSISSCPELGSTLSSDLSCLCRNEESDCTYAGGVDGRIHCWSGDVTVENPQQTIAAHNGRVTGLVVGFKGGFLFSVGVDGTLQCRALSKEGNPFSLAPAATLVIDGVSGEPLRVTALACVSDLGVSAEVILGTSDGSLRRVSAVRRSTETVDLYPVSQVQLDGEPTIHGICLLSSCNKHKRVPQAILVGHALGLSKVLL